MFRFATICLAALLVTALPAQAQDKGLERMLMGGPLLDEPELGAAIAEAEKHPLGSASNPVRVSRPAGQRAYLNSLRCSDGRAPSFYRAGNVGPGVYTSIVDLYIVDCGAALPGKVEVRMDMYHPGHVETRAVPGFTIAAPGSGTGQTL